MTLVYVQLLRFAAALAVVLFHSLGTGGTYARGSTSILADVLSHGDLGVDLFFVISGFVMHISTAHAHGIAGEFLRRRIHRIVPLYWTLTALVVALALLVPASFKGGNPFTSSQVLESLFFVSFADAHYPVIYVGWSLEFEMYFYLALGLLLWLDFRNVWRNLITALSAMVMIGVVWRSVGWPANQTVEFLTNPLLLEFSLGILVARFYQGRDVPFAIWAPLAVAFVMVLAVDPRSRVLVGGLPAAALVFLAARFSPPRAAWNGAMRVYKQLGDASYSIYLVQILVISAVAKAATKSFPQINLDVLLVLTTVVTVGSGYLCFRLLERPLSVATRGWLVADARAGRSAKAPDAMPGRPVNGSN